LWQEMDSLASSHGLPARVIDHLMFDAVRGYRIRRSTYLKAAEIEQRTASRDLARLVDLGILVPRGETRGRHYVAGEVLAELRQRQRQARRPLQDPYPWMRTALVAGTESPRPGSLSG